MEENEKEPVFSFQQAPWEPPAGLSGGRFFVFRDHTPRVSCPVVMIFDLTGPMSEAEVTPLAFTSVRKFRFVIACPNCAI